LTTLLTEDKIKNLILEIVAKEKPPNTKKLMQLMLQQHSINPESTAKFLIALENDDKLHFTKPETPTQTSAREYVFSQKPLWYWGIIALSIVTSISVFTIPEAAYPIAYVRVVLGIIFVLFLPGYTFIKALFPPKVFINTSSKNLDNIERITLSIGMSLSIVTIVGLFLNYTPWGIRLAPITLSLLVLTVICATAAVLRENQSKNLEYSWQLEQKN
jgi:hypothetical protein